MSWVPAVLYRPLLESAPRARQVRDTFDREERLAHAGAKTVRDALQTTHTEIAPMLKEPF